LYDACPHAPVASAHAHGQGQASYKPKQTAPLKVTFFARSSRAAIVQGVE
jgi:hypothetical protein